MGHKNFAFGKLHNFFGYFVKLGRFAHHLVGNAGKLRDKERNGPFRVNQGIILVYYLVAIVNKDSNFGNAVLGRLAARGFDINNSVQCRYIYKVLSRYKTAVNTTLCPGRLVSISKQCLLLLNLAENSYLQKKSRAGAALLLIYLAVSA